MDVTTADFEQEVLEASKHQPVVVDFWAPWCGPCRALTPVIEKIAAEFAGKVKLVKINSDENPELSSALNVRSIPNVFAFKNGRVAASFLGALPEPQVREFIAKLLPSASEEALERAEQYLAAGDVDAAEREIETVKPDPTLDARVDAVKQGIAFARAVMQGPGEEELRAKLTADANDHEARLALAGLYAAQRRFASAMDELLEIVRRAKNWREGEARRQLLALFNLASASEPQLVGEYRRKLANALH